MAPWKTEKLLEDTTGNMDDNRADRVQNWYQGCHSY